MNNKYKKIIKCFIVTAVVVILFFLGIKTNNWLEWKMAVEASGSMPKQLGITGVTVTQCQPSCYVSAKATCCAPQTGMCVQFVPGADHPTHDVGCILFSDITGTMAGGMGNMALLSNVAIAQAGLSSGGQLIYGGTTENMSMMTSGSPNAVLASSGGCYGCMAKSGFWNSINEKIKFIIAGFKNKK